MTQAEFSRRVQVAQSYLSALERGEKEPGAAVLLAISKEFGKSVDRLLTGKAFVEPKKRVTKDRQNVDSPFPTTGGLRAQAHGHLSELSLHDGTRRAGRSCFGSVGSLPRVLNGC